jgi:hypothetical protein
MTDDRQTKIDKAQLELEKKRIKNGKEIKPRKIKQEPFPENKRPKGLGAALKGGGMAGMRRFNRGGKV